MNQKHNTVFTEKEIKYKYDWVLSKFKAAKEKSETEKNIEKLEEICPFYKELDQLFGNRQNVTPSSLLEPIQIPERTENDDENILSSSLESLHITDETKNDTGSSSKKRKETEEVPGSPTKKKQVTTKKKDLSSEEKSSPFNSKTTSSGKNGKPDFTSSFLSSQKEKWQLDKERFEKEYEIKQQETELQAQRFDKELQLKQQENETITQLRKEELMRKKYETEANIKLREKELELQENLKKEEVRQTKMQLVKEMLSQGKSQDEIKELLELLQ